MQTLFVFYLQIVILETIMFLKIFLVFIKQLRYLLMNFQQTISPIKKLKIKTKQQWQLRSNQFITNVRNKQKIIPKKTKIQNMKKNKKKCMNPPKTKHLLCVSKQKLSLNCQSYIPMPKQFSQNVLMNDKKCLETTDELMLINWLQLY